MISAPPKELTGLYVREGYSYDSSIQGRINTVLIGQHDVLKIGPKWTEGATCGPQVATERWLPSNFDASKGENLYKHQNGFTCADQVSKNGWKVKVPKIVHAGSKYGYPIWIEEYVQGKPLFECSPKTQTGAISAIASFVKNYQREQKSESLFDWYGMRYEAIAKAGKDLGVEDPVFWKSLQHFWRFMRIAICSNATTSLLHGDLNPTNILVDQGNNVVTILDFEQFDGNRDPFVELWKLGVRSYRFGEEPKIQQDVHFEKSSDDQDVLAVRYELMRLELSASVYIFNALLERNDSSIQGVERARSMLLGVLEREKNPHTL